MFNSAKVEYENALENSGYHSIKLNYWTITSQNRIDCTRYSTEIQRKLASPVQTISPALSVHTTRN